MEATTSCSDQMGYGDYASYSMEVTESEHTMDDMEYQVNNNNVAYNINCRVLNEDVHIVV